MEEEAEKLKMLQSEVEKQINSPQGVGMYISELFQTFNVYLNNFYSKLTQHVY